VTESRDPCVKAELINEYLLNVLRRNRLKVSVDGTLGNDDNALSLAKISMLLENRAHFALPIIYCRRLFWYEQMICSGAKEEFWSVFGCQRCTVKRTHLMAAMTASQPQCLPMTSTTNARECEEAVEEILSTASQIRCKAVAAPIVKSVPAMSLSMLPTRPTMFKIL